VANTDVRLSAVEVNNIVLIDRAASTTAGNDSLVDTPTSYGTDTGVGNEVRGNYATLNALDNGGLVLTEGNLGFSLPSAGNWRTARGTFFVTSGKWYWEVTANTYVSGGVPFGFGIADATALLTNDIGSNAGGWVYESNGNKKNNGSGVSYGASWTTGNIIGVALDMDNGTVVFYKNGASQGTAYSSGLSGKAIAPIVGLYPGETSGTAYCNFGQRAFAYTAPSGFKALVDTNLPAPVVAKPSTFFDIVLRSGFGTAGGTVSGLNFSPDFIWTKLRSGVSDHWQIDTVRGIDKTLRSNSTSADVDYPTWFTSTTATGYTLGSSDWNTGTSVVEWVWDAGTSTVTNTAGSITSQVRANASAGFSVITYSGSSSISTVGHGLGVAPGMFVVKRKSDSGYGWIVYHRSLGASNMLALQNTSGASLDFDPWNQTAPTSSVFTVNTTGSGTVNASGASYVCYAWAPVSGYSSFGSYTGNGSSDGPFVFTGFRPKWVMLKQSSGSGTGWQIHDTSRNTYNVMNNRLQPNNSDAESTYTTSDFLSNGFKLRDSDASWNSSGATYIYACFAESPFAYSRAR
jgi:hypothetical protein